MQWKHCRANRTNSELGGFCIEKEGELNQNVFCFLTTSLQVKDLLQVTEALFFLQELFLRLLHHPVFWKVQLSQFCLQLLCFCEVCLNLTGECSSLISLIESNFELLKEVRVHEEKINSCIKFKECHV